MAGIGVVVLLAIAALLAVVMRRSGQTRPAAADALP
jgi:DHA2 family multidrug resistance protein-like MFS transporter